MKHLLCIAALVSLTGCATAEHHLDWGDAALIGAALGAAFNK